jgi:cytochrome c oxidase cbb3-type subunit 3
MTIETPTRQGFLAVTALISLLYLTGMPQTGWAESRSTINDTLSKPVIRGGIVFKHYCVLCHGEQGAGKSKASKLYKGVNLAIGHNPSDFERIIRQGGESIGRSPYMPPWEGELSDEQIQDVVAYINVVADEIKRGEVVYKSNCILCHGVKGDGKGRAAKLYNPPPADLTHSNKNDDYKAMIIRLGGKAMGRSEVMPPWEGQITNQEINDLLKYLRSILKHDQSAL